MLIIGKRCKDTNFKDLGVEPGVTEEESINGILKECKYNLVVRLHKLVYEALLITTRKCFKYLAGTAICNWLGKFQWQLDNLNKNNIQNQVSYLLSHLKCVRIFHLFNMYLTFLKFQNSICHSFDILIWFRYFLDSFTHQGKDTSFFILLR